MSTGPRPETTRKPRAIARHRPALAAITPLVGAADREVRQSGHPTSRESTPVPAPETDPTTPGDVIATTYIYSILGVDPHSLIYDQLQRPFEIVKHGRILEELIA